MNDTKDWKASMLFGNVSRQFNEHGKRIDSILSIAQERFEKDHTSLTAGVGIVMILFSGISIWFSKSEILSGIFTLAGAILLALALILRAKSAEKHIQYSKTSLDLERERARMAQRSAVIEHIWLHGFPDGTSLAQIQILLGDTSNLQSENIKWKQLPNSNQFDKNDSDE